MHARAILETVIYADDIAAAERFYGEVLGLPLYRQLDGCFAFFTCGPQMLLVFNGAWSGAPGRDTMLPRHGTTGPGHLCFRVADLAELDGWRRHLAAHDIAIEHEQTWDSGTQSIYLRDPAGNSIEFGEGGLWGL